MVVMYAGPGREAEADALVAESRGYRVGAFPARWGTPPADIEARATWATQHILAESRGTARRSESRSAGRAYQRLIELRREPSCGPVELLDGSRAQLELYRHRFPVRARW